MNTPYPLGGIQEYDPRNLNYPLSAVVNQDQINTIIDKEWPCGIIMDQGQTSSCVGNANAYNLAAAPAPEVGINESIAQKIYAKAQTLDGITSPHEGTTGVAGFKAVMALWPGAFGGYNWAQGIHQALVALSHVGPITACVPWYQNMFYPNAKGIISPGGELAGYHCITLNKNILAQQQLQFLQSWGTSWGLNGHGIITWHGFSHLLEQGGIVGVAINQAVVTIN